MKGIFLLFMLEMFHSRAHEKPYFFQENASLKAVIFNATIIVQGDTKRK